MTTNNLFSELMRYGVVTALSYVLILFGTSVLVEICNMKSSIAYGLTLTITYIIVYMLSAHFIFKTRHTDKQLHRYLASIIIFWLLNIATFYVLVELFSIMYVVAIILNLLIFGILRFNVYKYIVFKKD